MNNDNDIRIVEDDRIYYIQKLANLLFVKRFIKFLTIPVLSLTFLIGLAVLYYIGKFNFLNVSLASLFFVLFLTLVSSLLIVTKKEIKEFKI